MRLKLFAALAISLVFALCDLQGATTSLARLSFEEVINQAAKARREFCTVGTVKLKVTNGPEGRKQSDKKFDIAFEGKNLRFDAASLGKSGEWSTQKKCIIADGLYIYDHATKFDVNVVIDSLTSRANPQSDAGIFHPIALGYSHLGIVGLSTSGLDTLLGRSDRIDEAITEKAFEGRQVYDLTYKTPNGGEVSVLVSPDQGFCVLRAEVQRDTDRGRVSQVTTSDVKQYEKGHVWFPKKCIYTLSLNGNVIESQTISVEQATFGGPIDKSLFTLAGLNLAEGRPIIDFTRDYMGSLRWNGKEVEASKSSATSELSVISDDSKGKMLLWINVVVCLALAALLAVRYMKQKAHCP